MKTTPTREPGAGPATSAWGGDLEWGRCVSDSNPDYWAIPEKNTVACPEASTTPTGPEVLATVAEAEGVPTPAIEPESVSLISSVGQELLAQLAAVREVLAAVSAQLPGACSADLSRLAAEATAVVAAAEAARAAVILDADARGVIASSDNARVDRFVEQACRDAGVPVTRRYAATLRDIADACQGHDVTPLRKAVTNGRIGLDSCVDGGQVLPQDQNRGRADELGTGSRRHHRRRRRQGHCPYAR